MQDNEVRRSRKQPKRYRRNRTALEPRHREFSKRTFRDAKRFEPQTQKYRWSGAGNRPDTVVIRHFPAQNPDNRKAEQIDANMLWESRLSDTLSS